jgi:glycolate oxidase FAD binding subunit
MIGSLGTLGIVGQVTLKVKPRSEMHALMVCAPDDVAHLERLLSGLVHSAVRPAAVEVLAGEAWSQTSPWSQINEPVSPTAGWLAVRIEGTETEVNWMIARLETEWLEQGIGQITVWQGALEEAAWRQICEFPAQDAPLTLKITAVPSATTDLLRAIRHIDAPHNVQVHAGNGILIVRWDQLPPDGIMGLVVQRLRPLAAAARGQVTILRSTESAECTRQAVWGSADAAFSLMSRVKQQFDPRSILNPQRFLFP